MTESIRTPSVPPAHLAPEFDHERLDCFRVALEFQALATDICAQRGLGSVRDQFDRASLSIGLNIAEGVGRRSPSDKAHFFAIARGSAMECAAVLEVLAVRGVVAPVSHHRGRSLLIRIVQMLTRLIERQARSQ